MPCCEISDCAQMSKTIIAVRHFGLGGRESLETAVIPSTSLAELNEWIMKNWSKSQKHQAFFHNTFPVISGASPVVSARTREDVHSSERETVLRRSWMEVLQIDQEPEDSDNFVQSGGNSFSAVYLVSILRRMCSIEISIVDILQKNTYAEIRNVVRQARSLSVESTSIQRLEHVGEFPLSAAQQRMVLMQQTNPESTAYVETLAFRVKKKIDPNKIIFALIQKHPILKSKITINQRTLEYSRSIESLVNKDVKLEIIECQYVSEVFLKSTTPVINVTDSNLFQARFINAQQDTVLALHVHNTIVDDITLPNMSNSIE